MKIAVLISSIIFSCTWLVAQDNDFSGDFDKDKGVSQTKEKETEASTPVPVPAEKSESPAKEETIKAAPKDPERKAEATSVPMGLSEDESFEELTKAIRIGNSERTEAILDSYPTLLNKKDKFGNTPIFNAIFANQYLVVEVLMKKKADCKLANMNGDAPIHRAAQTGNVKILGLLLKSGVSVWTSNSKGESPILKAASAGQIEAIKFLLKNGAEINTPDSKGETPLHKAAIKGEKSVVKFLLDNKADSTLKNKEGQMAGDLAKNPEIKAILPSK